MLLGNKYRGALHLNFLYSFNSINIVVRCTIFISTKKAYLAKGDVYLTATKGGEYLK